MPLPPFLSVVDDWAVWLQTVKGRSRLTADKYRRHLHQLEAYAKASNLDPWDLSLEDLEVFVGLVARELGMTARSRRPLVAALRGFYSWARRRGIITTSPAVDLLYPSTGRRLPKPAHLATAEKLLMQPDINTFIGLRDAALLSTLIGCGLRVSGLVRMNRGHLTWMVIDGAERMVISVREKGDHERVIPVPIETAVLIRAYLASPELLEIDTSLPDGDDVLWVSTNNRTIDPADYYGEARRIATRTVHDMIQRYGERAKLPADQCHPHALRHLYATELAEEEIDILQRQTLMGHSDPKSTEIYTHVAIRRLVKSVDKGNPMSKMHAGVVRDARLLANRIQTRSRTSDGA